MRERRILAALLLGSALGACSAQEGLSPEAERGRQVYLAHCSSCHSPDPGKDGPLGPAIRSSSRALLEARILRGAYPPGYAPKRPSTVMQPMPQVATSLDDLAAFLR